MVGTWIQHWAHGGDASHLMPIGDRIVHVADEGCECQPALVLDGQELAWMHHALDGR